MKNKIWFFPGLTKTKYNQSKENTMSSKTKQTNSGATATNRQTMVYARDSRGRFASPSAVVKSSSGSNKKKATSSTTSTTSIVRDSKGRFSSNRNQSVPSKASNVKNGGLPTSSFIKTININEDNTVEVVMTKNPKTVYKYKPTLKGLSSLRSTLKRGESLGGAYNKHLRGREISRTIFR